MMVSKVAVIALVCIFSVPILLGYGMNFEETTDNRWVLGDQVTNVTPLISTGTVYTYAQADIYSLNTDNFVSDYNSQYQTSMRSLPSYLGFTANGARSSLPLTDTVTPPAASYDLTLYSYLIISNRGTGVTFTLNYYDGNGNSQSIALNDTTFFSYRNEGKLAFITQYTGGNRVTSSYYNAYSIAISGYFTNPHMIYGFLDDSLNSSYVDLTKGFKLPNYTGNGYESPHFYTWQSPGAASDVLITIDLDVLSSSERRTVFTVRDGNGTGHQFELNNTTINGQKVWTLNGEEIIYDNTGTSGNCYQILFNRAGVELHYIGKWPTTFGLANSYRTYNVDWASAIADDDFIYAFGITGYNSQGIGSVGSIKLRVDAISLLVSQHNGIVNSTYDPANITGYSNFETNLDSMYSAGSSIVFGSHTYTIIDGNITIDGHKVPVNKLKLSSTINGDGLYDNKIGDTIVSTTAAPSTIVFNGTWKDLSVSTRSLESENYTVTEWIPGHFAWDGMDSNFLMVGLLTSLAAFIGLGIYSRRSKASVWPLMIVTGGAAFLFLILM